MIRKDISLFLGYDHDRIDEFFKEFYTLKEKDPSKAKEAFRKFNLQLRRHMQGEEEVLLPLFEAKTGMKGYGPAAVIHEEHNRIAELLDQMQVKLDRKELATEEEKELFSLLQNHNHKEEYILYPVIDELTTSQERKEVLEKLKQLK